MDNLQKLSFENENIERLFIDFHTFEPNFEILKFCRTCNKKENWFLEFLCKCKFCTILANELKNEKITEYILHCFKCQRCICKFSPHCDGCQFISNLIKIQST